MENRIQYKGIDFFKFIMAIFVVVLHTHPLYRINETLSFLTADVIGRIAVPFFFVSTGFLLEQQIHGSNACRREILNMYVWKVLKSYFVWTIIYLPIIISDKIVGSEESLSYGIFAMARDFVFVGSYAHLWYLLAVAVGVPFVYLLRKYMGEHKTAVILTILFCMGLFTQSYFGLFVKVVSIDGNLWKVMKAVKKIMVTCRNGIFFGGIFIYMGTWISGSNIKIREWKAAAGLLISILFFALEVRWLWQCGYTREQDMYFMLLPTVFFLMIFAIQFPIETETVFFRKMSINIYYIHMFFKYIYRRFVHDNSGKNAGLFCFTLVGALLISYIMYRIEKRTEAGKVKM